MVEDMNIDMVTQVQTPLVPNATYAKPLSYTSKIEIFAIQHFHRWQERVDTHCLTCMG